MARNGGEPMSAGDFEMPTGEHRDNGEGITPRVFRVIAPRRPFLFEKKEPRLSTSPSRAASWPPNYFSPRKPAYIVIPSFSGSEELGPSTKLRMNDRTDDFHGVAINVATRNIRRKKITSLSTSIGFAKAKESARSTWINKADYLLYYSKSYECPKALKTFHS
ncbi:hypothetical protein KM043_006400 [Ampulex compressa]|nr:hypothetical protein KM043_006400 [Ampulex compressa]